LYKLLACDLDGTLLQSFTHLAESNIFYIKEAIKKGIKVVLCSGRSPASLKQYEEIFGIMSEGCYGIGLNGSVVYKCDSREIIKQIWFAPGIAEGIIKNLREFSAELLRSKNPNSLQDSVGLDILAYNGSDLYVEKMTPVISNYITKSRISANVVDNLEEININLSKVLVKGDYETLSLANEYMKDKISNKANMFFTGETMLEFTDINATKGNALTYLSAHLGIDMKDVIAIGDNENDISMIKAAGLGIAVKDAKDDVKMFADYITNRTCVEGVLEEVVEIYLT
jgi:Cof subfamily protein (haloacid dehalogenase superfamily)